MYFSNPGGKSAKNMPIQLIKKNMNYFYSLETIINNGSNFN